MIPAWLERATGGARRRARLDPCPTCGTWTLYGLDDDVAALTARVDVKPLDIHEELHALLAGKRTYNAIPSSGYSGKRVELMHRHQDRIRSRKYPVLAEHKCARAALAHATEGDTR